MTATVPRPFTAVPELPRNPDDGGRLCECGCGEHSGFYVTTRPERGQVAGDPREYRLGHRAKGPKSPLYRGGRWPEQRGYVSLGGHYGHPNADRFGRIREHVFLAAKALGKGLPEGAEVHHVNGDRADNRPQNLVLCQDHEYHGLLDARSRARRKCGDARKRLCRYCRTWDLPCNLSENKSSWFHVRPNGCKRAKADSLCTDCGAKLVHTVEDPKGLRTCPRCGG